jgi:hypothetical protein
VEKLAAVVDRRSLREMQVFFSRSCRNTARPTNAMRRHRAFPRIPIEFPSKTAIGNTTHSEFVLCERFEFRPSTVDGCSHQPYADGSAVTVMNFKSYTQTIPDPERRLLNFLIRKLKSRRAMKASDLVIYLLGIAGALAGYFLLTSPFCGGRSASAPLLRCGHSSRPDTGSKPVLRLAGPPGRSRTSCPAGSSPDEPARARHSAPSIRSRIRFSKRSALGRCLFRPKGTLLGNPREDGRALRSEGDLFATSPASTKR